MVNISIFFLVIGLLFPSCQNSRKETIHNFTESKDIPMKTNDWKRDKEGCLRLRSLGLAEELINKNDLLNKSKEKFLSVFGEPNDMIEDESISKLIYYIENVCKEGVPIRNADRCWIQFDFYNDELIQIPKVFACE